MFYLLSNWYKYSEIFSDDLLVLQEINHPLRLSHEKPGQRFSMSRFLQIPEKRTRNSNESRSDCPPMNPDLSETDRESAEAYDFTGTHRRRHPAESRNFYRFRSRKVVSFPPNSSSRHSNNLRFPNLTRIDQDCATRFSSEFRTGGPSVILKISPNDG